jgi:hypothetical protein
MLFANRADRHVRRPGISHDPKIRKPLALRNLLSKRRLPGRFANWCNNQPHKDQQEELNQLTELPRKWLATLRGLLEEADPFEPASPK